MVKIQHKALAWLQAVSYQLGIWGCGDHRPLPLHNQGWGGGQSLVPAASCSGKAHPPVFMIVEGPQLSPDLFSRLEPSLEMTWDLPLQPWAATCFLGSFRPTLFLEG